MFKIKNVCSYGLKKCHTVAINYAKYYSLGVFSWYYFFKKWWLHARLWVRQEKNIYFVLFIYIFWVQLNISMKKKSMANFSLNRSFLEKSVFPSKLIWTFYIVHKYRNYTSDVAQKSELVSFAWYYPNKQNSKSSSEFDLTNSMTTSVIWVHSQYFKIKHFMINVLFTIWLLMNTSTKVASA